MKSFQVKVIPYSILFSLCFVAIPAFLLFRMQVEFECILVRGSGPRSGNAKNTRTKRTRRNSCFKWLDNLSEGWRILLKLGKSFIELKKKYGTF
jgi:hypothetical protein